MSEKQKQLLELLREVDQICRRHGLRYVMAGGSMIGVMRNRGFIPWDDDIDIYMPRDDWEKFVEICKTEAPPGRTPMDIIIDRGYTNTFPRYGKTDGCVIHRHQLLSNDVAGEIIDVLTLDPIPADEKSYLRYREDMMLYSELANPTSVYGNRYEVPLWRFLWLNLKMRLFGREKVYADLEKEMFSWKEEDCDRVAMRWGGCPFLFDKDMFFPTKDMPFEDMTVMVPARVSDYLIWHYGDEWAYIPRHDERESHDTVEPPEVSYQEFRENYQKLINIPKIRRHAFWRKAKQLKAAKENHWTDLGRKRLLAQAVAMDAGKRVEEMGELETLLKERRFDLLSSALTPYFTAQLSADYIGREDFANIFPFYHPTLVPLEDDLFFAAMWTLLYTERVRFVDRMLKIYIPRRGENEKTRQLQGIIKTFRGAMNDLEQGDEGKAYEAVVGLCRDYPENPSFEKFRITLLSRFWKKDEAWKEAFLDCLALLTEKWPGDGFVEKYQADVLLAEGKTEEAIALYRQAVLDTNNGITHLEVGDILAEIDPDAEPRNEREREQKLRRNGYPQELVPYRLRLDITRARDVHRLPDFTDEELLFLELFDDGGSGHAEAQRLLGDILLPLGKTFEAFAHYQRAYDALPEGPSKEAVAMVILKDWQRGEKRLRGLEQNTDTIDYLDGWLDKYGDIEKIQSLARKLAGTSGKEGKGC